MILKGNAVSNKNSCGTQKPEGNISYLLIDKHLRDGLWLRRKMCIKLTMGMIKVLF
jgi:hypothetical protein